MQIARIKCCKWFFCAVRVCNRSTCGCRWATATDTYTRTHTICSRMISHDRTRANQNTHAHTARVGVRITITDANDSPLNLWHVVYYIFIACKFVEWEQRYDDYDDNKKNRIRVLHCILRICMYFLLHNSEQLRSQGENVATVAICIG